MIGKAYVLHELIFGLIWPINSLIFFIHTEDRDALFLSCLLFDGLTRLDCITVQTRVQEYSEVV